MRGFLGLLGLTLALSLAACGKPAPKAADVAAGKLFLIRNSAAPGVITTPSGLQYRVIHSGPADGLRPKLADEVKVNYEGKLLDGAGIAKRAQMIEAAGLDGIWIGDLFLVEQFTGDPVDDHLLELLGVAPDSTSVGKG